MNVALVRNITVLDTYLNIVVFTLYFADLIIINSKVQEIIYLHIILLKSNNFCARYI